MLFNSFPFLIFFPIVFACYWFLKPKLKIQNIFLLLTSYFFYACWSKTFLILLIFSTVLDYFSGLMIYQQNKIFNKKVWLLISVIVNLGFLCYFKYFNFFIDSFKDLLNLFDVHFDVWTLRIILPIGISFYTFHGLSYVFDIFNNKIIPEKNFINYAVFVSYFPLLVAGPIERATHLLPQIKSERVFEYKNAISGLQQMLWGFFKKIVIADNCAFFANDIFNHYHSYNGATLIMGAFFFTFQIYGDFSGYSDIALGASRLLGIELLRNFAYPYFSRDIAEFWRRWHISLSSWFKDYLYIPLGGSKGNAWLKIRNTMIIFLVSGFWHGANWTFIAWGLLNALYFIPLMLFNKNKANIEIVAENRFLPTIKECIMIMLTFISVMFAWIFFRSETISMAVEYIINIFRNGLWTLPLYKNFNDSIKIILLILFFMIVEWVGRKDNYAIKKIAVNNRFLRYCFYYLIIFLILLYRGEPQQFIYFQF